MQLRLITSWTRAEGAIAPGTVLDTADLTPEQSHWLLSQGMADVVPPVAPAAAEAAPAPEPEPTPEPAPEPTPDDSHAVDTGPAGEVAPEPTGDVGAQTQVPVPEGTQPGPAAATESASNADAEMAQVPTPESMPLGVAEGVASTEG